MTRDRSQPARSRTALRSLCGAAALAALLAFGGASEAHAAKCTKKGTRDADVLKGTKKKDVLCGKGGADTLIGRGGNDKLLGAGGGDTLRGGKGNDKLKGAAGVDEASFADSRAPVAIDLAAGIATGDGSDRLTAVEDATGTPFADSFTGGTGPNLFIAGTGDDSFTGGGGGDTFAGEGGSDTASYATSPAPVSADLGLETATGDGSDSLVAVENLIGGAGPDTFIGDGGDNRLEGGEGNDVLAGGAGADALAGQGGADTATYVSSPTGITANLASGVAFGEGGDALSAVENVTGSAQNDDLTGSGEANGLDGGGGDDKLAGGDGADVLAGGGGTDTTTYATADAPVTADLVAGTASGEGQDSLDAVENVSGSPQADAFTGDGGGNVFDAAGGDDILAGGGGDDLLDGGEGVDTVTYAAATEGVVADLEANTATGQGADAVPFVERLVGSGLADTFTGDLTDNVLSGGGGPDILHGGAGADQLNGQDGADELYGDPDDDSLFGGLGDDLLDGGAGSNLCDGGPGNNTMLASCDSNAPTLIDLTVTPTSVDTSIGEAAVTVTLEATDDISGVDAQASRIVVASPNGQQVLTEPLIAAGPPNTYEATVILPEYSRQGAWTVGIEVADSSGNRLELNSAELIADGHPGTFTQTGPGDEAAPQVANLVVTPEIDTSAAADTVEITFDATDSPAGVDLIDSSVVLLAPGDTTPRLVGQITRVSGTAQSGSYAAEVEVPRNSPQGTWAVEVRLRDAIDNVSTTGGSFQQVGVGDGQAPQLVGVNATPDEINTRQNGAQQVQIVINVTDDTSGVNPADSIITITDPEGKSDSEAVVAAGGNSYRATFDIPADAAVGTWEISAQISDRAGNQATFTSSQLAAVGFDSTFRNAVPDPT